MTCRGRCPILEPPRVCAQANGFLARGHFLKCRPYDPVTQALLSSRIGTSEESERFNLSGYRVNQAFVNGRW